MNTVWKVIVALALVVPMGAYVAGSLAASASGDPEPRHTIQIREPSSSPSSSPAASHSPSTEPGDDDEVEVITPGYDDLDDHGDDHGGDDHGGGDDNSGPGGGDDNSGPGGGG